MGTTPVFKIPYPEPSDRVTDYPVTGQSLANKLEAMAIPGATITNAITALAGWSLAGGNIKVMGKLLVFQASFTRTGAAITVAATGDCTNTNVLQINMAALGASAVSFGGPICASSTGRSATYQIGGTGTVSVVSVGGTGNIAVNEPMSCVGVAFVA